MYHIILHRTSYHTMPRSHRNVLIFVPSQFSTIVYTRRNIIIIHYYAFLSFMSPFLYMIWYDMISFLSFVLLTLTLLVSSLSQFALGSFSISQRMFFSSSDVIKSFRDDKKKIGWKWKMKKIVVKKERREDGDGEQSSEEVEPAWL